MVPFCFFSSSFPDRRSTPLLVVDLLEKSRNTAQQVCWGHSRQPIWSLVLGKYVANEPSKVQALLWSFVQLWKKILVPATCKLLTHWHIHKSWPITRTFFGGGNHLKKKQWDFACYTCWNFIEMTSFGENLPGHSFCHSTLLRLNSFFYFQPEWVT